MQLLYDWLFLFRSMMNHILIFQTAFEKRAIQATAEVQQQLKCPVSFHPGRNTAAPSEIMRIYQEAGGDARKAILSHLDRTFNQILLYYYVISFKSLKISFISYLKHRHIYILLYSRRYKSHKYNCNIIM